MGGRGNGAARNSIPNASATKRNEYGFDIENTDYPELEFTDRHWSDMAKLKDKGMFEDGDLKEAVDEKIYQLVSEYDDLARYDEDLTILRDRLDNNGVTDDEYWAGYHAMADMLHITSPTVYKQQVEDILNSTTRRTKLQEDVRKAWVSFRNDPSKENRVERLEKAIGEYNRRKSISTDNRRRGQKFRRSNDLNDLF